MSTIYDCILGDTAAQTVLANGAEKTFVLDDVIFDPAGMSNGSAAVIKKAGWYHIYGIAPDLNSVDRTTRHYWGKLKKNSTEIARASEMMVSAGDGRMATVVSAFQNLAVSDVISLIGAHTHTSNIDTFGGGLLLSLDYLSDRTDTPDTDVFCDVSNTGGQAFTTATPDYISFDQTNSDVHGLKASATELTLDRDGLWIAHLNLEWALSNVGGREGFFEVGGVNYRAVSFPRIDGSNGANLTLVCKIYVVEGTAPVTLKIPALQNSGGNLNTNNPCRLRIKHRNY